MTAKNIPLPPLARPVHPFIRGPRDLGIPQVFTAREIKMTDVSMSCKDGERRPARWLKSPMVFARWRLAWKVLIGRYDALDWELDK
jgi:hypothetical protein